MQLQLAQVGHADRGTLSARCNPVYRTSFTVLFKALVFWPPHLAHGQWTMGAVLTLTVVLFATALVAVALMQRFDGAGFNCSGLWRQEQWQWLQRRRRHPLATLITGAHHRWIGL